MRNKLAWVGVAAAFVGLVGVAVAQDAKKERPKHPAFEAIKALAGEWLVVGEDGQPTSQVGSSIALTAGGSVVRETLFPGTDHEMLTVYYLDGEDLVLTHYCVLGNQPHMKASADSTEKKIQFQCAAGGKIKCDKESHMHEGLMEIVGPDELHARWKKFDAGECTYTAEFRLVRRKN